MSSISGSLDKKSPEKPSKSTPERKGKKVTEPSELYVPQKVKTSTTCFVDEEVLAKRGTCVFRGEFAAPKQNKVGLVLLPSFRRLGKKMST